jgi:lycopene cyclase domain-containing protein
MVEYTLLALSAVALTVLAEVLWLHTGLFRTKAYWLTIAISFVFMIAVDGWLTKLSSPIVRYYAPFFTGVRFPRDIPIEDYAFGLAVINLALLGWLWPERKSRQKHVPS